MGSVIKQIKRIERPIKFRRSLKAKAWWFSVLRGSRRGLRHLALRD